MATGDIVAALRRVEVAALPASPRFLMGAANGGSAPAAEAVSFPADTPQYAAWAFQAPGSYAGAAIKLRIAARASIGIVGAARLEASFYRQTTATAFSTVHTYAWQGVTWSAPATLSQPAYVEIPFTQAQADGVAAGDECFVLLRRATADVADTLAGSVDLTTLALLLG